MGRKLLKDEIKMHEVIDLSWVTISDALKSSKVPDEEKRRIALEIVKKSVPQTHNHTGEINFVMSEAEKLERTERIKRIFEIN